MFSEIRKDKFGVPQLIVDGTPFPILGGELHNSSSSDLEYMESHVWPPLRNLDINTVLLPITWETVEPKENEFDFTLLEGILKQAKRESMKLVLLWFGLWKNGESHYVPQWVKKDINRFERVLGPDGTVIMTISPFCDAAVAADEKAFSSLMAYLREKDKEHTVIMVQIENEMGILGTDRDYSESAQNFFVQEIPKCIAEFFGRKGTWKQAFGIDASEYFMAWKYATVIEQLAKEGKKQKALPMYVNAWLEQHPDRPGIYPSGGPVAKLIPLWKHLAPSVDMISPDIYEPQFGMVCREYTKSGNVLFIPEAARNAKAASRVLYAFGEHHAIGFCPFGIENIGQTMVEKMDREQLKELNIMREAMDATETERYLPVSYRLISGIYSRMDEKTVGFIQEHPYDRGKILDFDNYCIQLDFFSGKTGSGGFVLPDTDAFYIVGCCVKFSVLPPKGKNDRIEILRLEEGEFTEGIWKRGRILNGDELWNMQLPEMPSVRYVKLQRIAVEETEQ